MKSSVFFYSTGMLITGCLLQNVPVINVVGKNIDNSWSGALR